LGFCGSAEDFLFGWGSHFGRTSGGGGSPSELFPFRVEDLLWICVLGFELFFDFAELFAESLLFGLKFSRAIFVTLCDQFANLSFDLGVLTA